MRLLKNEHSNSIISSTYGSYIKKSFEQECFTNMRFTGNKFENSQFKNVVFVNCDFQATEISNCMFIDCSFVNCNFEFTKFKNCNLIACKLDDCHFCITNSLNCNYLACTFIKIDWDENFHSQSKFEKCSLQSSQLPVKVKITTELAPIEQNWTLSRSWESLVSECLVQAA